MNIALLGNVHQKWQNAQQFVSQDLFVCLLLNGTSAHQHYLGY